MNFAKGYGLAALVAILAFLVSLHAHERYPESALASHLKNHTQTFATTVISPVMLPLVAVNETYHRRREINAWVKRYFEKLETVLNNILKMIKRGLLDVLWPDIVHMCTVVYDLVLAPLAKLMIAIPTWLFWSLVRLAQAALLGVATLISATWPLVYAAGALAVDCVLRPLEALLASATRSFTV